MANALVKFGSKVKNSIAHVAETKPGVGHFVIDKGERYLSAGAFGYIKGRYREKATVKGQPIDLVVGGGALGLALIDEMFFGGHFAPHLNRISDSGLSSYINSRATYLGNKAAGRKLYVSEAGANPQIPAGIKQVDVLGDMDAMGGVFLSDAQVQQFAKAR